MEQEPDYARCSPRELMDVARRINRKRFPERYARVLAEIEKRRANSDDYAPVARTSVRALVWFVAIEYGIIALLGIIGPIVDYSLPLSSPTDMPMGLLFVPLTSLFFALTGGCFALMRWGLRSVDDRELVKRQSLKALVWAPLACLLLAPVTVVFRVALGFILPFDLPAETFVLLAISLAAAPFVALFWRTKQI